MSRAPRFANVYAYVLPNSTDKCRTCSGQRLDAQLVRGFSARVARIQLGIVGLPEPQSLAIQCNGSGSACDSLTPERY